MSVHFFFLSRSVSLTNRLQLKSFISNRIFKKHLVKFDTLNYIFCTDEYLLGINQQFLKHDYYTDIISFNLASKNEPIQGEIYISLDRVRDNAELQKTTLKSELHRVIFHGALHLCGYKDKSAAQSKKMRILEDDLLSQYLIN